nr:hypothetical protein [Mammaliicoccus sp. Marseille-Q6498]
MIDINNPFISSGLSFQIILKEPENQEIFDVDDEQVTVAHVSEYLNKPLKVISVKEIESELYGLIVKSENIIGWTKITNSLKLISKEIDTVKIVNANYSTPEINRELGFNHDYKLLFKDKVFSSRALYQHNGEILEAIFNKGLFVGFVRSKDIDRAIFKKEFIQIDEGTKLYTDSGLTNEVTQVDINYNKVETDLILKCSKLVRITVNKKKYWIEYHHILNPEVIDIYTPKDYTHYSELELQQLDIISNFQQERNDSKKTIVRLIKENMVLEKNAKNAGVKQQHASSQYENLYNNLKNSKLGKIQTKYWSWKKRRASK